METMCVCPFDMGFSIGGMVKIPRVRHFRVIEVPNNGKLWRVGHL